MLSILLHVPALGAGTYLDAEHHKEGCATRDAKNHFATFAYCDCGAYGEVGPPRDFWSLAGVEIRPIETQTIKMKEVE